MDTRTSRRSDPKSAGAAQKTIDLNGTSAEASIRQFGPIRAVAWLGRWIARIVWHQELAIERFRGWARAIRVMTWLLIPLGATFGILTGRHVRQSTFTPLPVHLATAISIVTFLSVGYWMLCHSDRGTQTIGWMFMSAACAGSVVYVASSYAHLALDDRNWRGGVLAGWIGDALFIVAIAALLPRYLALIPNGRRRDSVWPTLAGLLSWFAALLLLFAVLFEKHLFTHPSVTPPLAAVSLAVHWAPAAGVAGLIVLSLAVGFGVCSVWARAIDPKTLETEWNQLKWYIYGALLAGAALIPYLLVLLAPDRFFPSAPAWARWWGVITVTALAISAVPAINQEPWRPGRIRRLVWGAGLAASVTALHEVGVVSVLQRLENRPAEESGLLTQIFATYAIALALAIAFEPVAEWVRGTFEDRHHRRGAPEVLLEQALADLRSSAACLDSTASRAEDYEWSSRLSVRLASLLPARRDGQPRRLTRVRAVQHELNSTILAIDDESKQAATLIATLLKRFGDLKSACEETVALEEKVRTSASK